MMGALAAALAMPAMAAISGPRVVVEDKSPLLGRRQHRQLIYPDTGKRRSKGPQAKAKRHRNLGHVSRRRRRAHRRAA
jgi:hypothetical protein